MRKTGIFGGTFNPIHLGHVRLGQMVLNDLNLKKVVEGDEGITDALNAINDSLGSLGTNYEDPSIDDLIVPDKASAIKVSFDAIMAE